MAEALAKYVVSLEAETARYRAELQKANQTLQQFTRAQQKALDQVKGAFLAVGAVVSVGMFARWIKSSIDAADAAEEMSQRFGLSVETITGLRLVLQQSGVSVEQFGTAMQRMAKTASDAASGTLEAQRAFGTIGVSVQSADGKLKSMDQLLREVSDKFAGMENGAQKAALAQEIFGRAGGKLIPVLNQGGAALDDYIEKSRALGDVWTNETAAAAAQFNDNLDVLGAAARGVGSRLAQSLLPNLTAVSGYLISLSAEGDKTSGVMWALSKSFAAVTSGIATMIAAAGVGVDALKALQNAGNAGARGIIENDLARIQKQIGDGTIPDEDLGKAMESINALERRLAEIPDIDPKGFGDRFRERLDELAVDVQAFWGKQSETAKAGAAATVSSLADMLRQQQAAEQAAETQAKNANRSDRLVAALQQQAATLGQTATQAKLYELSMLGASAAQMEAARSASAAIDAYERLQTGEAEVMSMFAAIGAADIDKRGQMRALEESLQTQEEAIRTSYERTLAFIKANTEEGSQAQARLMERLAAKTDEQLAGIESKTGTLTEFGKAAAANIQGAFADFLFDPFSEGLDGMLEGFLKTMQRMVAEVASQQILKGLFSGLAASGNPYIAGIGAAFAGARANGGQVSAGRTYLVGERGPELFMPSGAGRIIPGGGGGGTSVQIIDQRGAGAPPVDVARQMAGGMEQIRVLIRSEVGGMFSDGTIDRQFRAASMPVRRVGSR